MRAPQRSPATSDQLLGLYGAEALRAAVTTTLEGPTASLAALRYVLESSAAASAAPTDRLALGDRPELRSLHVQPTPSRTTLGITDPTPDLASQLAKLGLRGTAEALEDLLAHATKSRLAPLPWLTHIAAPRSDWRAQPARPSRGRDRILERVE